MREQIKQLYNIEIDEFKEYDNSMIINSNEDLYIFKRIENRKTLDKIWKFLDDSFHKIIPNKNGEYVSYIKEKEFVLMKIENKIFIVGNNIKNICLPYQNEISVDKWEKIIDSYKQIIDMNSIQDEEIIILIYYSIGLTENLIKQVNKLNKENIRSVVSRNRLDIKNYSINFYDPTNLIIDGISRDYAEYVCNNIDEYINNEYKIINEFMKNKYSNEEIEYFLIRLLYPSYILDKIEKKKIDYNETVEYINKVNKLYNNIYNCIKKTINIQHIDWISIIQR